MQMESLFNARSALIDISEEVKLWKDNMLFKTCVFKVFFFFLILLHISKDFSYRVDDLLLKSPSAVN